MTLDVISVLQLFTKIVIIGVHVRDALIDIVKVILTLSL